MNEQLKLHSTIATELIAAKLQDNNGKAKHKYLFSSDALCWLEYEPKEDVYYRVHFTSVEEDLIEYLYQNHFELYQAELDNLDILNSIMMSMSNRLDIDTVPNLKPITIK